MLMLVRMQTVTTLLPLLPELRPLPLKGLAGGLEAIPPLTLSLLVLRRPLNQIYG